MNYELENIFSSNYKNRKKIKEILENDLFIKELIKSCSKLYSIKDLLKIFNPDYPCVNVIEKLDTIFEKMEMQDELAEYIVEIEFIKEVLLKYNKYIYRNIPVMNNLAFYYITFLLEILNYGTANSFYEYCKMLIEVDDDGNPLMVILLLHKILQTLKVIIINCYREAIDSDKISEVTWEKCTSIIDKESQSVCSEQVCIEFNEYLLEKGFFENQPVKEEVCIIS
jgi:hypothetical protein